MQSKIEDLTQLLPPPVSPRNNEGYWPVVEAGLGTALPTDYKQFTTLYGTVKICNYLVVHTAFPWDENFANFLLSLNNHYDAVVEGRANIPLPDYPALGGLLPIGGTDNGDIISWITGGDPEEWGIFVWIFPGISTYTFRDRNLTAFLVDLLSLKSRLFPTDMPDAFFSPERRGLIVTN